MQICRICLAADRKMFPISDRVHIYEQITGLSFSSEDHLPKNVCWECGHYMSKYVAFKSRAVMSYCTLIEILKKDGLITESSIENCNQSTLTSTNTLCLLVQEECNDSIVYYDSHKTVDVKDESIQDLEDESLKKNETFLSDDLIEYSPNIESIDSFKINSHVEKQLPSELPSVKRKVRAAEASKDKKNSIEKHKKTNNITKLAALKRKVSTVKEKKDFKLLLGELDKELLLITELTLDEQIAEILNRKESDNYLNSPHTCDNCFKGFHDFEGHKRHTSKFSESGGPHACPVCGMCFGTRFLLNAHMRTHVYKFSCTQCNFSTICIIAAKQHQNYHQEKTYKCPHCEEVFHHNSTYLGHLRFKHPSDLICKHCGYTFLYKCVLKQHIFRYHRDDLLVPADGPACARCDIRFSCQDALHTHRRVSAQHADERNASIVEPADKSIPGHGVKRVLVSVPFPDGPKACELESKDFKCDRCGKSFQHESSLNRHKRYYCGTTVDHWCSVCGKTFASRATLQNHMKAHKCLSFQCEYCNMKFRSQDTRKQHVEYVHKIRPLFRRNEPTTDTETRGETGPPETEDQNTFMKQMEICMKNEPRIHGKE